MPTVHMRGIPGGGAEAVITWTPIEFETLIKAWAIDQGYNIAISRGSKTQQEALPQNHTKNGAISAQDIAHFHEHPQPDSGDALTRGESGKQGHPGAGNGQVYVVTGEVKEARGQNPADHPFRPCNSPGCSHVAGMHSADPQSPHFTRCTVAYCTCAGFSPSTLRDPWAQPPAPEVTHG